jgi:squalene cyclase
VERYLSERQNPEGSWGGELLTTLAGALALHSVGVDKTDPRISKAIDHLAHWKRQTPDGLELLARTSEVRNTADAVRLLCDSGLGDPPDDRLLRALDWLLDQQADQSPPADWILGGGRIGGWAVGPHNFMRPDCATTGAVLAAIGAFSEATPSPKRVRRAMRRGAAWLLEMQHDDGGWSPFGAGASDPETTAQAAAGLGRCGYRAGDPPVDQAVRQLRRSRISPAGAEALFSVGLEPPQADRTATPPPPKDIRDRTAERIRRLLDYV